MDARMGWAQYWRESPYTTLHLGAHWRKPPKRGIEVSMFLRIMNVLDHSKHQILSFFLYQVPKEHPLFGRSPKHGV